MKQKKTILWIVGCMIICTMALFGMAGCGSSDEEQAPEETTTVETTTEAVTEAPTEATAGQEIGEEKALEIALADAGLTKDAVDYSNSHLDIDDGRTEYDVEFRQGTMEYDYTIDAYTGDILEKDAENDID